MTTRPTTQEQHHFASDSRASYRDGRLLGAQLLGYYGAEVSKRVDIYAAALHHHMTIDGLTDLDLSYTPPLSSPWDPTQMAALAWQLDHSAIGSTT